MFDKIIIIGQSNEECEQIKTFLTDTYFVVCVQTSQTALKYIEKNNDVRLILLDLEALNFDPEKFLKKIHIHAEYRNIKIIIAAKQEQHQLVSRCLEIGANDFINKPLNSDALKMLIDLHINSAELEKNNISSDTNVIFETLFKDAPVGVSITRTTKINESEKMTTIVMNPAFSKIIDRDKEELRNYDWKAITHPDDLADSIALFQKLERREIDSYSKHKRYIRRDGTITWVNLVVSAFDLNNDEVFSFITLIQDITEQIQTTNLLNESERSKSVLLSHLPGLAYRCDYDANWTMRFVSKGCKKLTGYDDEDLLNNNKISFNEVIAPEYRERLRLEWIRTTKEKLPFSHEYEIITKDDERKWVLEVGEAVYDSNDNIIALEGIIIDIDYLKKIEAKLIHQNDFDTRTELHNRSYLERLIDNDLEFGNIANKALVGLNFISIQSIVTSNGYHFAMDLMKRIGDVLKKFDTPKHRLFITHENRFCFYINSYENKQELISFYETVKTELDPIMSVERISCGVGILEIKDNYYLNADTILKDSLIATERALNIENGEIINYTFSDKKMQLMIEREKKIREELIKLSEKDDSPNLIVQFQPVIDLKTGRIVSFEALSRLNSEKLGLISPLEFIPILEKTKLIIPVGEMILKRSLMFLKQLNSLGYDVSMSINVSAIQLLSEGFASKVVKIINDIGVKPTKIWLEITESIFSNNYQRINAILANIIKTGVRITIDDFGTGYSSLHRILEINVNGIKIDRAFINGIENISEDIAITKDIVSLGQKLNYVVVAEGIENDTQRRYLKSYNCDRAQGYFFSRPLDEDKALQYIDVKNK